MKHESKNNSYSVAKQAKWILNRANLRIRTIRNEHKATIDKCKKETIPKGKYLKRTNNADVDIALPVQWFVSFGLKSETEIFTINLANISYM